VLKEISREVRKEGRSKMNEIVAYELDGKKFAGFTRVSYGKKDTPEELREYSLENVSVSPVGTRKEIKKFMQDNFTEMDGVMLDDPIEYVLFREYVLTENL